jgi:hypothetical protein
MNQQEATRAGAVSWLRARRTVKEIMSYGDFNKNTVVGEGDLASQLLFAALWTILRGAFLN